MVTRTTQGLPRGMQAPRFSVLAVLLWHPEMGSHPGPVVRKVLAVMIGTWKRADSAHHKETSGFSIDTSKIQYGYENTIKHL
jgi:hypothetical protein